MKKIFFAKIALFVFCSPLMSQDISLSQFYENPLLRNPALAGIFDGEIRVSGTLRNQWESVTVPYKTQALGAEVKVPVNEKYCFTTGLAITNDIAGDLNLSRVQFLPAANFHVRINEVRKSYFSVALMGGYVSNQFDPTNIKLGDQYDASTGGYNPSIVSNQRFERTSLNYWDVSTGFSWSSSFDMGEELIATYYAGLGIFNLLTNPVLYNTNGIATESNLSKRWVFNGGLTVPVSKYDEFIFYGDYSRQGGSRQLILGALYGNNIFSSAADGKNNTLDGASLYGGAFYRWNDAIVPTIKLDLYNFSFGFSYDVNVSQLQSASQHYGGSEITISYRTLLPSRSREEVVDLNGRFNNRMGHFKGTMGPVF